MEALRHVDSRQRLLAWAMVALILHSAGCATLRRHKDNAECVGACRQLSREGLAAMEHGDDARARTLLEQAIAKSPTDVDAQRQLAEVLWKGGVTRDAVEHIEAAVKLD